MQNYLEITYKGGNKRYVSTQFLAEGQIESIKSEWLAGTLAGRVVLAGQGDNFITVDWENVADIAVMPHSIDPTSDHVTLSGDSQVQVVQGPQA